MLHVGNLSYLREISFHFTSLSNGNYFAESQKDFSAFRTRTFMQYLHAEYVKYIVRYLATWKLRIGERAEFLALLEKVKSEY